jgi:formylglycine-generating enzyme required for sulfatase activity
MKTCPICQQAYSDDVEFCARDGARLGGEVREERECPYCAERILKKARVCRYCGRDVEPLVAAEASGQSPSPAAPERPAPCPPEEVDEPPPAPSREPEPITNSIRPPGADKPPQFEIISEPRSNKWKSVLVAAAGMALVVAAVLYFSHRGAKKGDVRDNPKDGLKYVWIPSGTFTMGCSPGDNECYDFEKPPHQVSISEGYWLGQTEVTVGAFKRFVQAAGLQMPSEPQIAGRPLNPGWGNDAMPIVNVSWADAAAYCQWAGGRLPTEAEWENAARAGNAAPRYGDLDQIAWYADNSGSERLDSFTVSRKEDEAGFLKSLNENGNGLHEVGQKHANDLALFDTLGNVWEWVYDWWDTGFYRSSPPQDPVGPASGVERVLRGGSWIGRPRDLRVSLRSRRNPADKDFDVGFRCGGPMDIP